MSNQVSRQQRETPAERKARMIEEDRQGRLRMWDLRIARDKRAVAAEEAARAILKGNARDVLVAALAVIDGTL
jgi:hypothetical protein